MKTKRQKCRGRRRPLPQDPTVTAADRERNEKRLVLAICVVLFLFGALQSILFYGHQVVPNSDFPDFYSTGRAILSFKLPGSFKRGPVTGILQNLLTPFMPGRYPDLKAGWMLNAILHPLNGVLLFLIARQLVGRAAKWFAFICLLNPWVLYLLTEPIAETTPLFFILLTVWLIFLRTRWCYLAASVATMVRYECAALILAAVIIDLAFSKTKKQRLAALALAFAAGIPVALWMIGTVMTQADNATHYFHVFKPGSGAFAKLSKDKMAVGKHLNLLWSVGYGNLASLHFNASESDDNALAIVVKVLAAVTFLLGVVAAVLKRSWRVLVLGIFLVPYFLVHAWYPYPLERFHLPIFWIALLISVYGLVQVARLAGENRLARMVAAVFQIFVISVFAIWFFSILPNLERAAAICPKAAVLPWVALGTVVLLGAISLYLRGYGGAWKEIAFIAILPVVVVSSHLSAAEILNTGSRDAEFKELADWYAENGRPGERLVTTLTAVVRLYLPDELKSQLVNYQNVEAEDLLDYAEAFRKQGIVWVAWDSRLGFASRDPYYELYHLEHFQALSQARDVGPYTFVTQFRNGRRFVNLFRLEPAAP